MEAFNSSYNEQDEWERDAKRTLDECLPIEADLHRLNEQQDILEVRETGYVHIHVHVHVQISYHRRIEVAFGYLHACTCMYNVHLHNSCTRISERNSATV